MNRLPRRRIADLCMLAFTFIVTTVYFMSSHQKSAGTVYPAPLRPGDKIAILAPAGPIGQGVVDSAAQVLRARGYRVDIMPHTLGKYGHFSGTHPERLADLTAAFTDPEVRAILCARGGYGVVHNLDALDRLPLRDDPKWVIGFSDISALHALMASHGIASVHSSMAKQIALGDAHPDNAPLLALLEGTMPTYEWAASPLDRRGHAEGKLLGGNLAVLADLIATPFDIITPGCILFIEDVSEPIYKIERIMYQLRLSGALDRVNGLILGQFTDYRPDDNHQSMEAMLAEALAPYGMPIAFGAPIGHVDHNIPLAESAWATLDVGPETVTLRLER